MKLHITIQTKGKARKMIRPIDDLERIVYYFLRLDKSSKITIRKI